MQATYAGIAITGPTGSEYLASWDNPTTWEVDKVPGCRAERKRPIPMGNAETPLTLRFARLNGSYLQTCAFKARLESTLPKQGPLVLNGVVGGDQVLIIYPDACKETLRVEGAGDSALVVLTFATGEAPSVYEIILPDIEATLATWDFAAIEDLDERPLAAAQLSAA